MSLNLQHTCKAEPHEDASMGVLGGPGLVVQDPGARNGRRALGDAQPCSTARRVARPSRAAALTPDMPHAAGRCERAAFRGSCIAFSSSRHRACKQPAKWIALKGYVKMVGAVHW